MAFGTCLCPGPHGVAHVLIYPCGKAWKNPPFPSRFIVSDRSSPSRVRFAASRPGRLRADPKDALLTRGKGGAGRGAGEVSRLILRLFGKTPRSAPHGPTPLQALQREGPGEGGSEEEPHHDVAGVGERHPRGAGAGGPGGEKRGFGCGPTGWSRTIRRFGRSGTASSSGSRRGSRGSIGSFRRSRGRLVKRSFFETTWRRRWRHEISGLNWRNRPAATTVQPEHGPQPQLALVYRIQQAPGHFMDNEDTRVPTVHIRERRAYHRRHAAGTLGRPHGQYRPDSSWRTLGGVSRRTRNQPIPLGESDRHTSATHQ